MSECKKCEYFGRIIREQREEYDDLFEKAQRDDLIKIKNFINGIKYEWSKHICPSSEKFYFETMRELLKRPKWVTNQEKNHEV